MIRPLAVATTSLVLAVSLIFLSPVVAAFLGDSYEADGSLGRLDSGPAFLVGISPGLSLRQQYSLSGESSSLEDTDAAGTVFGIYQFLGGSMGVGVSHVNLGSLRASGPAFGGFTDRLKAEGINYFLMGAVPAAMSGRVAAFSTVGLFRWRQVVDYFDAGGPFHTSEHGSGLSYSVGVNFYVDLLKTYGFHLQWSRYRQVGDINNSGHVSDIGFTSLGYTHRFGM